MEQKKFDIVVIGSGPGGYVAAIKASQYGKSVALIEKDLIGGTCLNVGCIPTKTMIASAHIASTVKHAGEFGVNVQNVEIDYAKMKQRKDSVVEKMRKGLEGLIRSNGVTIIAGQAEFINPSEIKVKGKEPLHLFFDKAIIATGSAPMDIPSLPCDHKRVFNSTSILELTTLPKHLVVIGGGYIGCEFASLYAELGVKVTIVEALPMILAAQGKGIADFMTRTLTKKGIDIHTQVMVEGIDTSGESVQVILKDKAPIECDAVLISIGRKVVSDSLAIEKAGIKVSEKGMINVDNSMQTSTEGIYAIGDVTGKYMLAHVASHQGIVAAAHACGEKVEMNYDAVPAVIFTHPEVAMVGMTPDAAESQGIAYTVGKFPFQALGKAVATMETEGFAQIVTAKETGQILGAQVIGSGASALIAEMSLAISAELTVETIADTIHAHPTLPEAWMEAALVAGDMPIHLPPKVKKG